MIRFRLISLFAVLALVLASSSPARAQTSFKVPTIDDAIMLTDQQTFVVSIASKGSLIYFDTMTDKQTKDIELDFQPASLAAQNDKLFVAAKGGAVVHVLEAATAKPLKEIKVGAVPITALACHPAKGLLYAVNAQHEVFAIDPAAGKATKTAALGQFLAVDPSEGKFVYTGIQKPIRDVLVLENLPGGRATISLKTVNARAVMIKYGVDGDNLKDLAFNDNAAVNGRRIAVSPDGKRVAMIGLAGWWSKPDAKVRHSVGIFDAADLQTQVGALNAPGSSVELAYHPVLNLGAIYMDPVGVTVINAKSLVIKSTHKLKVGAIPCVVAFGGKGTKVIAAPMPGGPGSNMQSTIEFIPLALSDQDKEALKKAYAK